MQSTFGRQNEQNTSVSEHSWKLRCSKSARRRQKHFRFRPLLGSQKLEKRTQLWREARFKVKIVKTPHVRTTVGRSSIILCGRHNGNLWILKRFKNDGMRRTFEERLQRYIVSRGRRSRDISINIQQPTTTTTTTTTLHYKYNYNYIQMPYTTLEYSTVRYITVHHTKLQYTTLHYTTPLDTTQHALHYATNTLRYATLQ